MSQYGNNPSPSGQSERVVLALVGALVICFLAFLVSSLGRAPSTIIGVPGSDKTSTQSAVREYETIRRLDSRPRGEDQSPKPVRENGLPEAGDAF